MLDISFLRMSGALCGIQTSANVATSNALFVAGFHRFSFKLRVLSKFHVLFLLVCRNNYNCQAVNNDFSKYCRIGELLLLLFQLSWRLRRWFLLTCQALILCFCLCVGFLKSRPSSQTKFFQTLMRTQVFFFWHV